MKVFAIIVFVVKTLASMVMKVFSMSKEKNDYSSFDIERQIADAIKAGDAEKVAKLRKYLQSHRRRARR